MRNLFLVLVLLFAGAAAADDNPVPQQNPSEIVTDSQSTEARSNSDCRSYTAATTVNVWVNAPAEVLSLSRLWLIRWVRVRVVTDSATPYTSGYISWRHGPTLNNGVVTPVLSASNGDRIFAGEAFQVNVRRPNGGATVGGVFPAGPMPIWVLPQATVDLCVTYFW